MKHRLLIVVMATALASVRCNRSGESVATAGPEQVASTTVSTTAPVPAPAPAGDFTSDLEACRAAAKILERDEEFIRQFTPIDNREAAPFASFLLQSRSADERPIAYLIANARYFDLGVNMHGAPYAVARVGDTGIYCAPTRARLDEAEQVAITEATWRIREFFLTRALDGQADPASFLRSGLTLEALDELLTETSSRYTGGMQRRLIAWLNEAVAKVGRMTTEVQAAPGSVSIPLQLQALDERAAMLRRHLAALGD